VRPRPDFRDLALEHSADDLVVVVASAVTYRELSKLAIKTIVERDRQIASLQRQLEAVKSEYAAHRARIMRASLADNASEAAVPMQPRTYTPRVPTMPPRSQRRRTWRPPQGVS
jgi:hypothetical protein